MNQHQTILWREMVESAKTAPTIYVGTKHRRATIAAVNARLEFMESIVSRLVESDPIHRFECNICGCLSYETPFQHAADCIWQAAQSGKER